MRLPDIHKVYFQSSKEQEQRSVLAARYSLCCVELDSKQVSQVCDLKYHHKS